MRIPAHIRRAIDAYRDWLCKLVTCRGVFALKIIQQRVAVVDRHGFALSLWGANFPAANCSLIATQNALKSRSLICVKCSRRLPMPRPTPRFLYISLFFRLHFCLPSFVRRVRRLHHAFMHSKIKFVSACGWYDTPPVFGRALTRPRATDAINQEVEVM